MNHLPKDDKGRIRVGGPVSSTVASLRIGGEDLDPSEITALLGCEPTKSHRKGDVNVGSSTGNRYVRRSGLWCLEASESAYALNDKIVELLDQVAEDLHVWRLITNRFSADVFCGLFMDRSNEGLDISATTLARLGERGIKLGFDIYGPAFEDDLEGHFEAARLAKGQPHN